MPGFQMIKDRVIKPLIVASEKVVEYYFKDESAPQNIEGESDQQMSEQLMAEGTQAEAGLDQIDVVSIGTTGHL